MHDWPDKYCIQILLHLRAAAAPETRLIIVDTLLSYTCADEGVSNVPGAASPPPPAPLLPNLGHVATPGYCVDIQVRLHQTLTIHRSCVDLTNLADDGACQRQGAYGAADEGVDGSVGMETGASAPLHVTEF